MKQGKGSGGFHCDKRPGAMAAISTKNCFSPLMTQCLMQEKRDCNKSRRVLTCGLVETILTVLREEKALGFTVVKAFRYQWPCQCSREAKQMRFMRRTAGCSLLEHRRNAEILEELKIDPINEYVQHYHRNWKSHMASMCCLVCPKDQNIVLLNKCKILMDNLFFCVAYGLLSEYCCDEGISGVTRLIDDGHTVKGHCGDWSLEALHLKGVNSGQFST
ncbi:hypothetical protein C0J52_23801 [Blattella germanica]|nr:hypothetical protein C0J52_23801 [Blattella germanica]